MTDHSHAALVRRSREAVKQVAELWRRLDELAAAIAQQHARAEAQWHAVQSQAPPRETQERPPGPRR